MEDHITLTNKAFSRTKLRLTTEPMQLCYDDEKLCYPVHYAGTLLDFRTATQQIAKNFRNSVAFFLASTVKARELMQGADLPYLTQAGDVFLSDPPNHVYFYVDRGQNPIVKEPKQVSDYTRNDLKVLFAWITLAPSAYGGTQGDLARYAGVSDAAVTRTLNKLTANGYPKDRDYLYNEQLLQLMQTWAEAYQYKLKPTLAQHRFRPVSVEGDWRELPNLPFDFRYSGVAAAAVERYDLVSGEFIEVYGDVDTAAAHLQELRWIPDQNGLIHFYEKFWGETTIDWCLTGRSDHHTAPLLTYADLLATTDARAMEIAERDILNICLRLYRRNE